MYTLALLLTLTACKKDGVVVTGDTDDTAAPPTGLSGEGGDCLGTTDCAGVLVCASEGVCAQPGSFGTTSFGEDCFATQECEAGLVCDREETCNTPGGPGTAGSGDECATLSDCQSGLSCYEDACTGFDFPVWEGIECPGSDPPFRVHFEIPRGPTGHADFYRLPFPNDIRVDGTTVDVSEFPTSGFEFLDAGDVPASIIESYDTDFAGFGTNQAVFFRLSALPTFDTILVGLPGDGSSSVVIVDITPGAAELGQRHPTGWKLTTNRPYLCDPWIALYPSTGRPLLARHTYAALITTNMLGGSGEVPVQDPDFAAMLGGPPADAALQGAWEAYAPLRDWLSTESIPVGSLAAASVFTVLDPVDSMTRLHDVVGGSAAPVGSAVVECGDLPGPHADLADPTRGCFGATAGIREIQGALGVPHLQQGTAPFKTVQDGGAADWSTGQPTIQSVQDVTFSISIPDGPLPPNGWPVVLYAHDQLGNYRSVIEEGLAVQLADYALTDGAMAGFAVVSMDTWMTGPRRGEADAAWLALDPAGWEPAVLYDNPLNPVAARDNISQSAADWFQMVRYLEFVDWSGANSPIGDPVVFDLERVYFMGHGMGATVGPILLSREPVIGAGVLANAGASWTDKIADTTAPIALAGYPVAAFGDADINRYQPIISLSQGIVDRTEPLSHARYVHLDASSADTHVLQVFGAGDPFVPFSAQHALARGLFLQQVVAPGLLPLDALDEVSAPVSGNISPATAIVVVNDGSDPHRLLFDDPRTQLQVLEFLGTAARDGAPTVPSVP